MCERKPRALMKVKNSEVTQIFRQIKDILEIKGENPFRIRAYEKAAQNIEGLSTDVEEIAMTGRLEDIPGIGADLANKINEIIKTGRLEYYEQLKKEVPQGITELLSVPGVGPRTGKLLYEQLKITSISTLEKKARAGKLRNLPGLKEKTEENILKAIELIKRGKERIPLYNALRIAQESLSALKVLGEVKRIDTAGSLRRRKETVRDIDILVVSARPFRVMDVFTMLPEVDRVLAKGLTKSSVLTKGGVQLDLRVVEPESYGAALMYFTGSKAHNIRLREMAIKKGLKINEYGVFKGNRRVAGKEEEEIFRLLELPYILPELREDNGEIEAALEDRLPRLVEESDIKGDLHIHSKWSDGAHTIEELVKAAKQKGYSYIAISDHSQSLKVAGGLSVRELKEQVKEIRKLNRKLENFSVLCSAEVEIKSDGCLDYSDDILKELDFVIAAIHSGFKQSKQKLTERIIAACENKYVGLIAHPTGRLIGTREAYEIDMGKILKVAAETYTALEVNAYSQRLDLNDINCRRARESGVKLALTTDAHTIDQLDAMSLGLSVARRGWLEKDDILNTLAVSELNKK